MRRLMFASLLVLLGALVGCSGGGERRVGGRDGGGGAPDGGDGGWVPPDGPVDPTTAAHLSGVVWAPGNAPGMVPAGQEIPVFDALIRVLVDRPAAIPQTAYCEQCESAMGGWYARSDHRGNFSLRNLIPGTYWLVVEKGQFRLEKQITLAERDDVVLGADMTTLPSVHNPSNGEWVPRMAIATGDYDDIEDVLGKMSVGDTDGGGRFTPGTPATMAIDFYSNGGADWGNIGSLTDLVSDLGRMLQYHIIFIPCAGTSNTSALNDQSVLNNIREYVKAGGKLYVTDWSGEWHDNVFPAHVTLGEGDDTPAEAYDPVSNTWNTSLFGDANGGSYDSDHAEAIDEDLRVWLHGQAGPYADGGEGPFDASDFHVEGNWNVVEAMNPVLVGYDMEGLPVYDTPVGYVIGDRDGELPKKPLTVTYEPAGCGRVLYSTYHTTDTTHVGLAPQERILLYLIMEIGVCKEGPILI